jgi:hypothetical protein
VGLLRSYGACRQSAQRRQWQGMLRATIDDRSLWPSGLGLQHKSGSRPLSTL